MNEEIDYTAIPEHLMAGTCGKDAMKWATAFIQYMKKHDFKVDEDLMLGWFANSMEQMRVGPYTEEEALGIAARIWCRPETEHITMNPPLAEAFADVLRNGEDNSI